MALGRKLPILIIVLGLLGAWSAARAQAPVDSERRQAAEFRRQAAQWDEMTRKAEERAAKSTDPASKSVWEETARHHAEQARQLRQQAQDLDQRAASEGAPASEAKSKALPSETKPLAAATASAATRPASAPTAAGTAIPGQIAAATPQPTSPPEEASVNSPSPSPELNPAANPEPTTGSSDVPPDLAGGSCSCPELPALPKGQPPTAGHVRDELSEADLEAMFSNRDQIYSGWGKGLNALAHDIDPGGSLKIWSGPAPKIIYDDIALKEGGESGRWDGHPLPPAQSYRNDRAGLLARNRWSWGIQAESFAGPFLATLARTRKYGSPEYTLRHDLLQLSLFLGETLANAEVETGPSRSFGPPSDTKTPAPSPTKSPEAERLEQEAAGLRARAADIRHRAQTWEGLEHDAEKLRNEVSDPVAKQVWKEIAQRYQEEAARLNKQAHDLEDEAAEKSAQASNLRGPPPVPPMSAEDLRRASLAKVFASRFRDSTLRYLYDVTPRALELLRNRPHPVAINPLEFRGSGRRAKDELPLDVFDVANAALDVILWHDDLEHADTGWLTYFGPGYPAPLVFSLVNVLVQLAAAGPKFAPPGAAVSTQQAALACKAFSTLVYLADSDAKDAEKFQRAIFSNTGFSDPTGLAARSVLLQTGIASAELARNWADAIAIRAMSNTHDSRGQIIPKARKEHDFHVETAVLLATAAGGKHNFRGAFSDAIERYMRGIEANRRNGTSSEDESDFHDRWRGRAPVMTAGLAIGPTGQPCRALTAECSACIEAEKPIVKPADFKSKPRIVVESASHPQRGEVLDSLNRDEPFWIDLWLPTDQPDSSPTVTIQAQGSGQSESLRLRPRGRKPGFLIYSNAPTAATFSHGGEGGGNRYLPWFVTWGRGDMGPLKTENGDIVKVSYPGADTVEFQAFDDVVQQTIARTSKALLVKELYYDALLSDPDVAATPAGAGNLGYYLHLKVRAIANARSIMNYRPKPEQNWFTDLTRANIGVGYLDFIDSDARAWDSEITSSDDKGAAAGPDGRFGGGVQYVCAAEAAVVRVAIESAQRTQEAATMHHLAALAIGAYRIALTAACLAANTSLCPESIWIALTHTTATGEEVDEKGMLLNDLGIVQPAVVKALSPALARLKAFAVTQFTLREGEVLANEARLMENAAMKGEEVIEARRSAVLAEQSVGALETVEQKVAGQTVRFRIDRSLGVPGAELESTMPLFVGKENRTWARGGLYPVQIADDSCRVTVGEVFRRKAGLAARNEPTNLNIMYERVRFLGGGYTPGEGTERQGFAFFLEGEGFKVDVPKRVQLKDIEQELALGKFVEVSVNVGKTPLKDVIRLGLKAPWHSVSVEKIINAGGRKLVKYYDPWNGMFGYVDACRFEAEMNPATAVIADPARLRQP